MSGGLLALGAAMLLAGCASEPEAPSTTDTPQGEQTAAGAVRLADDPVAMATLSALQQSMAARANRLPPQELEALRSLYLERPDEQMLLAALNNAYVAQENWAGLRDLWAGRDDPSPAQQLTLGKAHIRLGEWQQAERVLLPLADASPLDPELAYVTARTLRHLGRREEASARLDAVEDALRQARHADAMIIRALLHLESDEPAAARDRFQEAIAIDPSKIAAHEGLGRALAALGEREQAVAVMATVDALHQAKADATGIQMRLSAGAEALKRAMRAGDMAEAERLVDTMLDEAEEPKLRGTLHQFAAQIYAATSRPAQAVEARATATALAGGGGSP